MKLDPTGLPIQTTRTGLALDRLEEAARDAAKSPEDLEKVAKEFEALMLAKMVESMRKTVPESGLLGKSASQGLYDNMMDEALAKHLSQSGGLGIADVLMKRWGHERNEPTPGGEGVLERLGRPVPAWTGERNEATDRVPSPDELQRILAAERRDLGGRDDGETPLAEMLPPSEDGWLYSPEAEAVLRAIISGEDQ
jgi:flagellar protein FlgJ